LHLSIFGVVIRRTVRSVAKRHETIMTKQKVFVFNDPDKLTEMLILRSVGYKTVSLGIRYKVDQSAISHQCKKYCVTPGKPYEPVQLAIGRPFTPIVHKNRYDHILYEPINNGKRNYRAYLEELKNRKKKWKNLL